MAKTISLSVGKGSIGHNNRTFFTENIDKSRTENNVYFVKQDLKNAYSELFDEAIKNYNVGKKPSRQKKDYMKEIENSGNGEKLFQEIVVQFGDKDDTALGSKDWDTAKQALTQYAQEFQARNDNVHVFNSVLHLDESTPHLHISFIPVAENYKTGLSKRNSFSKSMNDRFNSKEGVGQWFKYERNVLADLALTYGIETQVLGEDRQHLAIKDYKIVKDAIQDLEKEKVQKKSELNSLKTQIESRREELEDFKVKASKFEIERTGEINERLNKQIENYNHAVQKMKNQYGNLKEMAILHNEKGNLIQENKNLKTELVEKDLVIEKQKQIITQQQVELSKKDKIIAKLQRTMEVAKEFIQDKASWLSEQFNRFFKEQDKTRDIEVLEVKEHPRTSKTVKLEIKEIEKTLDELKNEEFVLELDEIGNLETVLEPKSKIQYQNSSETLEALELPLNGQDEWLEIENEYIPVNSNYSSEWVEQDDRTWEAVKPKYTTDQKPSLMSQLREAQKQIDAREKRRKQTISNGKSKGFEMER